MKQINKTYFILKNLKNEIIAKTEDFYKAKTFAEVWSYKEPISMEMEYELITIKNKHKREKEIKK